MDLTQHQFTEGCDLELFREAFLVPTDWKVCGPVVYISGAPKLNQTKPVALALTETAISLCDHDGPVWSLPVGAIQEVKEEDMTGVSFPIKTPSGTTQMVPQTAVGIVVTYLLNPKGVPARLKLFTLSTTAANDWINDILTAISSYAANQDGRPDRR